MTKKFGVLVSAAVALIACSSSTPASRPGATQLVAEKGNAIATAYAENVHDHYALVVTKLEALSAAVDAFVAAPTEAGFEACKRAWKDSRPLYTQSEVYRFYDGPIEEVEGRINGWPLDENFVDYIRAEGSGGADGGAAVNHPALGYPITSDGIVNQTAMFPNVTKEVISEQNESGGEKNLSAGFHAIEFLLWGQDFDAAGAGKRPYTDFVTGGGGTAANQDRRRAYLKAATDLLVDDMKQVAAAWALTGATYGAAFGKLPAAEALSKMLKGMGSLAGVEMANERMNNAYTTKEQEEEHNCFSDTTVDDLYNDGLGVQNVYLGTLDGKAKTATLSDLVRSLDAALDEKMRAQLTAAVAATRAIPTPFDQAFLGGDDADGRKKIKAAIDGWKAVTATIVEIASAFALPLNIE